jgi:PPM family protein phosphatase
MPPIRMLLSPIRNSQLTIRSLSNEPPLHFDIAIRASQGARRSQEDCAITWPLGTSRDDSATLIELPAAAPGVMAAVLCDGMGGHAGGAIASRLACEHFLPAVVATLVAPVLSSDAPLGERLMLALDAANTAITNHTDENPQHSGMGSTLVGVHADAAGLSWISVGDSLLYLVRQGELMTLNADHSLAPEIDKLAETGKISWAAARSDPRRHYLRSALTGEDIDMIDLSERAAPLADGDVLIIASDGIHTLETDTIAQLVASAEPQDAATIAARLVAAVEDVGVPHQDNTTVIVIAIRDRTFRSATS